MLYSLMDNCTIAPSSQEFSIFLILIDKHILDLCLKLLPTGKDLPDSRAHFWYVLWFLFVFNQAKQLMICLCIPSIRIHLVNQV